MNILRLLACLIGCVLQVALSNAQAVNPIIFADVPDMAMIRVGDNYYMSSTTMHMNPGLPIMKSKDLVNWELIGYAYEVLDDGEKLSLENGENAYGGGTWASSLRFHEGTYYATTFSNTTGKTYIFRTKDIEKGNWQVNTIDRHLHDHTLFFDDDGRVYLVYGGGEIKLVELDKTLSGVKEGIEEVTIIENASAPSGGEGGLPAEGSQLFKVNGYYYLFNISWPKDGMRTVLVHRAKSITGPWEGRKMLEDRGIAQGGLIDTPDGRWFSYLFRDYGSVGRIPYLVPVEWEEDWPVLGEEGKVSDKLDLPPNRSLIPGIVDSDDFVRDTGDPDFPLVWQWNHNPVDELWSLSERPGFLRLKTNRIDTSFYQVRNMLTQRTFGPSSSGSVKVELESIREGDFVGLAMLQREYGFVAVTKDKEAYHIVRVDAENEIMKELARVSLHQKVAYFKVSGNFEDRADKATFFYSLDGTSWTEIGSVLNMSYTLPHFMGYRFALFYFSTKYPGGYADFDYFQVENQ